MSHFVLGHERQGINTAVGRQQRYPVGVHRETGVGRAHVVGGDHGQPFALQFLAGVGQQVLRFGGKANRYPRPAPCLAQPGDLGQDVVGAGEVNGQLVAGFLDLLRGHLDRR